MIPPLLWPSFLLSRMSASEADALGSRIGGAGAAEEGPPQGSK